MEADVALRRALEAFGLEPLRAPQPVDNSVLNLNYRVENTGGAIFLRWHRAGRPLERLQREHAGAAWAGSHGLPVAQPLPTPGGESIIELDGRFWSAYRWIEGSTSNADSNGSKDSACPMAARAACCRKETVENILVTTSQSTTEGSQHAFGLIQLLGDGDDSTTHKV